QFANQHVERLRHARLHRGLAFDDGLVDFGAPVYIVRLRGQQLLQDERRAVRFQSPDFHFSETLASELRLATQRLLRDERVRPDGTRVNLVVHQVRELQHVDVTHRDRLFELLARHAVAQGGLARGGQARALQQRLDFRLPSAVEYGRSHEHAIFQSWGQRFEFILTHVGDRVREHGVLEQSFEIAADGFGTSVLLQQLRNLQTQFIARPSEVGFKNLPHVHTAGHTERVQDDLDRRSILEVRHILFRQNARDHALVAVAPGHFVADAQLALHRDVHLHQLDHARRQLIALGQLVFLFVDDLLEHVDLARGHFLDLVNLLVHPRILVGVLDPLQVTGRDAFDRVAVQNRVLGQQPLVGALVVQIGLHFLAAQQAFQALQALIGQNSNLVRKVLLELRDLVAFNGPGALVLLLAFSRENLHVHHDAFDSRRAVERSVAHVAGFFAEDRAQQFLFRRQLGLTLRRNFADDDVTLLDAGADADHARFVQLSQRRFTHVRNVARHFLGTELRVASFQFELFDVNRGVVILFHHLFRNQDRVLKVVAAPRHERDQHVASESQLAKIGAWTVGNHLPLHHPLAFLHDRLLVDTGVLVRALEFGELINVAAHLARKLHRMMLALDTNNDAFGIDRIDDSVAARQHDRARIARGNAFHARAHNRSLSPQQRHRLTLHVRAHQRAVGVVVLQEGHQRSSYRNQLLRTDVHVVHFVAVNEHEVARLARVDQFSGDAALFIQLDVGLSNSVPVFLPRREIERKRLDLDRLLAPFFQVGVDLFHLALFDVVADLVAAVTGIDDDDVVHHARALYLAVWRLDETVVVDARKAAQRRDQSDVRTFRGFNRADASVVRRV